MKAAPAKRTNGHDVESDFIPAGENTQLHDLEIREMKEKFPTSNRISVKRLDTTKKTWETLGSVAADVLDEDYMIDEFGPGRYTLQFRDAEGRVLGAKTTIDIGERARPNPHVRPPAPAAPIAELTGTSQIELLKQELERRDAMMLRMIDAIAQRQTAPAPQLTEMVTALASMQKLMPAAPAAPPPTFSEKLMERAFNMAAKGNGADDEGGNELFSFLRDVWKEVKPQLMPQASPAAPAADDDVEETTVDLTALFTELKSKCEKQRTPAMVAEMIVDQAEANANFHAIVCELIERPFEELAALDVDLTMPAYRDWFLKLYEELRVRLLGSPNDTGGSGGDASHS